MKKVKLHLSEDIYLALDIFAESFGCRVETLINQAIETYLYNESEKRTKWDKVLKKLKADIKIIEDIKPIATKTAYPEVVRIKQIIGSKKENIPAMLPMGRTAFYSKIKQGIYPQPTKMGTRMAVWKTEDILTILKNIKNGDPFKKI